MINRICVKCILGITVSNIKFVENGVCDIKRWEKKLSPQIVINRLEIRGLTVMSIVSYRRSIGSVIKGIWIRLLTLIAYISYPYQLTVFLHKLRGVKVGKK